MSNYLVEIYNDDGNVIQSETFKKLTQVAKKYNIACDTLYNIVDGKCLKKSRLSIRTKQLMKKIKIITTLNNELNNVSNDENENENDEIIVDNYKEPIMTA